MRDFNDMGYFAEIVDRGGFAAAARALGVTKSLLSRRIADLETRLGVRLLQRTTRKLSLTDAGITYHRHCVTMREAAEAAEEAIAYVKREPSGMVRLSCPVSMAQGTVGPLMPTFLARYPQVRMDMLVTNRVVDLVEEGIDVALRVRETLDDSATLIARSLGRTETLLVASPVLIERFGIPEQPSDLQRLPTLAMSAVNGRAMWRLFGPKGQEFDLHHQPLYTASDLPTLKIAALSNCGVTLIPDFMVEDELANNTLQRLLPDWAPAPAQVFAVFPSRRGMSPAVRRLLDFLLEHAVDSTFKWRNCEAVRFEAPIAPSDNR